MPNPKQALPRRALLAALGATLLTAAVAGAGRLGPAARTAAAPPATVLAQAEAGGEGWFTDAQADRGAEAYARHCAECHAPDARARSTYISLYNYPSLAGAFFWDRWEGQSVHALYEVIRSTMPLDAPESLDADTYADVTAHLLRTNGLPAGDRELPTSLEDAERLASLVLEESVATPAASPRNPTPVELRAREDASEDDRLRPAPGEDAPPPGPPEDEVPPPWYRGEQADRGRVAYTENCARCHGRALQGTGAAPSLAGGNFVARWEEATLEELAFVIRAFMPLDAPGSLDPGTYTDVLAYLLERNGFVAGEEALPEDMEALKRYVIRPDHAEVPDAP